MTVRNPQRNQAGAAVAAAPPSPLMSVDEVAAYLRRSRAAIYKMVERGQVPGVRRLGRKLYFHRASLLDWLDQNPAPSLTGGQ